MVGPPVHFRGELVGGPLAQLDAGCRSQVGFAEPAQLFNTQGLKGVAGILNPLPVKHGQLPVAGPERRRRWFLKFVVPFLWRDEPANPVLVRDLRRRQAPAPGSTLEPWLQEGLPHDFGTGKPSPPRYHHAQFPSTNGRRWGKPIPRTTIRPLLPLPTPCLTAGIARRPGCIHSQ